MKSLDINFIIFSVREKKLNANDPEPILSNYTFCPRHFTGKEHEQLRRDKLKQHKRKARWPQGYPKQNDQEVEDKQEAVGTVHIGERTGNGMFV